MDEFEESYEIPQIMGAIDACHIEIDAPPDNHEDYFNWKQHCSVNLQGMVNSNLKFIHADILQSTSAKVWTFSLLSCEVAWPRREWRFIVLELPFPLLFIWLYVFRNLGFKSEQKLAGFISAYLIYGDLFI